MAARILVFAGSARSGSLNKKLARAAAAAVRAAGAEATLVDLADYPMLVLSEQFALGRAHEAFNDDGSLKDAKQQAALAALAGKFADVCARLSA